MAALSDLPASLISSRMAWRTQHDKTPTLGYVGKANFPLVPWTLLNGDYIVTNGILTDQIYGFK